MTLTRRSLLGLAVLAAAGCRHKSTPPAVQPNPDAAALASARAGEVGIVGAYDAAIASATGSQLTRLAAERAVHAQHLAALHAAPSATPLPGDIKALLRSSVAELRAAAVTAVDGANAALLASVGASHASVVAGE